MFLKELFEKNNFEKISADNNHSMKNYPAVHEKGSVLHRKHYRLFIHSKTGWRHIKSKKLESSGVAPLKNKDGYIHNDSSSKVEILNEQFVSAYTKEDSSKIPTKGP